MSPANGVFIDWRAKGYVTPVHSIGGNCKAHGVFSAIAALETAHAIKSGGELLELSRMQALCCGEHAADWKCKMGIGSSFPLDYGFKNKYMQSTDWADWVPDFDKCPMDRCGEAAAKGKVNTGDYKELGWHSYMEIKNALPEGPIISDIQMSSSVFQHYKSGILDSEDCGTEIEGEIVIVGFGTENGKNYYIIKNFLGTDWGEQGYARIAAINGPGICGISSISLLVKAAN